MMQVIKHTEFSSRLEFDMAMHNRLVAAGVEIICLAGFMRVLTGEFVKKWRGRLINIHPSLLPAFKGTHAHQQVLNAGVRLTGCTVHFVEVCQPSLKTHHPIFLLALLASTINIQTTTRVLLYSLFTFLKILINHLSR